MNVYLSPEFKFLTDEFERLSVVDASVIPKLPRMNPAISIVSLGRYAGLLKRRIRQKLMMA